MSAHWEYKTTRGSETDEYMLNGLGEQKWELVAVTPPIDRSDFEYKFFFKRLVFKPLDDCNAPETKEY